MSDFHIKCFYQAHKIQAMVLYMREGDIGELDGRNLVIEELGKMQDLMNQIKDGE